jgi:hypothetical protein
LEGHVLSFDDKIEMDFGGEEFAMLPAPTGVAPARDKKKIKDPKVCEHLRCSIPFFASSWCRHCSSPT